MSRSPAEPFERRTARLLRRPAIAGCPATAGQAAKSAKLPCSGWKRPRYLIARVASTALGSVAWLEMRPSRISKIFPQGGSHARKTCLIPLLCGPRPGEPPQRQPFAIIGPSEPDFPIRVVAGFELSSVSRVGLLGFLLGVRHELFAYRGGFVFFQFVNQAFRIFRQDRHELVPCCL